MKYDKNNLRDLPKNELIEIIKHEQRNAMDICGLATSIIDSVLGIAGGILNTNKENKDKFSYDIEGMANAIKIILETTTLYDMDAEEKERFEAFKKI